MWTSRFSIGIACSKSSALPCGMPSCTSIKTMSASSFAAIQWAAVAPTLPAPTILTFLRIVLLRSLLKCRCRARLLHALDHVCCEFACLHLRRAWHLPLEVISYLLVPDRLLHG